MVENTVQIQMIPFETAHEAIQHSEAAGDVAILLDGPKVVSQDDADCLAAAGVEVAYVLNHKMPDGSHRIMTVPVN